MSLRSVPARLAAFAALLALTFAGAALAGDALDPTDAPVETGHGHGEEGAAHDGMAGHDAHEGATTPGGLAVSQDGYGLEVERTTFVAGRSAPLRFRITDADGAIVRDAFEELHERELHLIVVRRDTAHFQHLHPTKDASGTWSIDLTLPEGGVYRMYADFSIDGEQRTLATDLFVPGDFRPLQFPTTSTGDGVTLEAGELHAGESAELDFAVAGDPELEPYLGARGHLVALREGDLAYLHVHPEESDDASIPFMASFPTAGRYRLFLQYKVDGEVRTADLAVEVER